MNAKDAGSVGATGAAVDAGPDTGAAAGDAAVGGDGDVQKTTAARNPRHPVESGRVLVVIPTYNEAKNLEAILERVREAVPSADCLVVDDNSPDGTGRLADQLAQQDAAVHVLHRTAKEGLGAAYLAGFDWGMRRGYAVLVEMDADGSHSPEELPRLLAALADADLVLGSRWVPGGRVVNWPLRRKLLSRGGNLYTKMGLGIPLRDATGGFRAFRRDTLESISLHSVASAGYCFQVDLARRTLAAGLRVVEVPITFVEREHGESKMSRDIVGESLLRVTGWAIQARWRQGRRLLHRFVAERG